MIKQKLTLQRTTYVEAIVDSLNGDPAKAMRCFRRWPIEQIRLECLKVMQQGFYSLKNTGWAENTTEILLLANDEKMARKVFECYLEAVDAWIVEAVSNAYDGPLTPSELSKSIKERFPTRWLAISQAVRFAARIGLEYPALRPPAAKIVCGQAIDFPECYATEEKNPVRLFFTSLLVSINRGRYSESEWQCALRVLKVIMRVGDTAFRDFVAEIIESHERGEAGPNLADDRLAKAANLGVFREVLCSLKQSPKP